MLFCHLIAQSGGSGNLGISETSQSGLWLGSFEWTVVDRRTVGGGAYPICDMSAMLLSMIRCDSAPISGMRLLMRAEVSN